MNLFCQIKKIFLLTILVIQKGAEYLFHTTSETISENQKDIICPNIPDNYLVMIEHMGIPFIAKIQSYDLGDNMKGKICYFIENETKPAVILNKHNFKYIVGDIREIVAKHSDMLLEIAKVTKTRSIIALVNILKTLNLDNEKTPFDFKEVKDAYKIYKYRLNIISPPTFC